MAGTVTVMAVVVLMAVLPAARATLQPDLEFDSGKRMETFPPFTSPHALTLTKFAKDTNTSDTLVCFTIRYWNGALMQNITLGEDDENNTIAILYQHPVHGGLQRRDVLIMQTGETPILLQNVHNMYVQSDQRVRWQVFYNVPGLLNTATAVSSASAMSFSSPSPYLSPEFLTVASLCVLFALSTLVLSVLLCQRCASAKNGHGQAASSSDSTTFKSTENLVSQHAYFPYNHSGRGSLHISENSLYGVI